MRVKTSTNLELFLELAKFGIVIKRKKKAGQKSLEKASLLYTLLVALIW